MTAESKLARVARAKKPQYLDDRANDQLLEMILVLTQELSVTRDRLDSLERLVAASGTIDLAALDRFEPDAETEQLRSARRADLLARLTRSLEANLTGKAASDAPPLD